MTITRPLRRITLHLSQMGLTLGFTFMVYFLGRRRRTDGGLLVAVDDAPAGQVIWAQLHHYAVLWEDPDVVLAHLP
jgi:hypothetical protein